jgi:metal-sulfur cluster biosynthetic enzyme
MSMVLLTEYIIENERKIARFDVVDNSIPLYVMNLAIVESITTTEVKIKMKMSEFFLVSAIE